MSKFKVGDRVRHDDYVKAGVIVKIVGTVALLVAVDGMAVLLYWHRDLVELVPAATITVPILDQKLAEILDFLSINERKEKEAIIQGVREICNRRGK